jgi:hypothetical protein
MLGFLFGLAFAFFVVPRLRARGFSRGFGRGTYSRRRRRREWILDRLSSRLDTTPSQDAALGDVVDALFEAFAEERGGFSRARAAVADALAGADYDGSVLDRLRAEQDASMGRLHAAVADALARAHAVLDDEQRAALAAMIQRGPHGAHRCRGRHLRAA